MPRCGRFCENLSTFAYHLIPHVPSNAKSFVWLTSQFFEDVMPRHTAPVEKSSSYKMLQHFVSRNLLTVSTAIHQIVIITYFTNFYDTFYATPCVPHMN